MDHTACLVDTWASPTHSAWTIHSLSIDVVATQYRGWLVALRAEDRPTHASPTPQPPTKVAEPPAPKRRKAGGNPYFLFQNSRMEAAKQIAAAADLSPAGTLTDEARARVIQESKAAWANMTDEGRKVYLDAFRDRQDARRALSPSRSEVAPLGAASASGSRFSQESAWGMGTAKCAVNPAMVQAAFRDGRKLPTYEQVFNPTAFMVPEGTPLESLRGDDIEPEGCPCLPGTTLCQLSLADVEISRVVLLLNKVAKILGAVASRSCDILVMLEGAGVRVPGNGGARSRLFGLLSGATFKPLGQEYTICEVLHGHDVGQESLAFPFDVRLMSEPCRLLIPGEPPVTCLRHMSGDEFAQMAVGLATHWTALRLEYQLVDIMTMRVTGASKFEAPAGPSKVAKEVSDLLAIHDLEDPSTAPARPPKPARKARAKAKQSSASSSSHGGHPIADGTSAVVEVPASNDQPVHPHDDDATADDLYDEDLFGDMMAESAAHMDGELIGLAQGLLMGPIDQCDLLDDQARADDGEEPLEGAMAAGESETRPPQRATPLLAEAAGPSGASSSAASPPGMTIFDEAGIGEAIDDFVEGLSVVCEITDGGGANDTAPETSTDVAADKNMDGDGDIVASAAALSDRTSAASASSEAAVPTVPTPAAPTAQLGEPIQGAPAGWVMNSGGYVFDDTNRYRCRITDWGKNRAIRIPGGQSKAVQRAMVTNGELIQWMLTDFAPSLRPGKASAKAKGSSAAA